MAAFGVNPSETNCETGFMLYKLKICTAGIKDFCLEEISPLLASRFDLQAFTSLSSQLKKWQTLTGYEFNHWYIELLDGVKNQIARQWQLEVSLSGELWRIKAELSVTGLLFIYVEMRPSQLVEAEAANQKHLAELELIFNSTQDALFLVKCEANQCYYVKNNARHEQLSGYSSEAIAGKLLTQVLGPSIGTKTEDNCRHALLTQHAVSYQDKIAFKGEERVYMTRLTPMYINDSHQYVVGSRVDITELSQVIEEKGALAEKFSAMFTLHTAVMLLIEPFTGQIIDANPAAVRFYGYSLSELKQLRIHDINMMNRKEIEARRLRALKRSEKYFIFPHKLKNGEVRLVDVYSSPINFGGEPLLYSIIFDVTERENNRDELFREKEFLNITLNSIGDGVVTTDVKGRITRVNQAAQDIIGYAESEMLHRPFGEVFALKNEVTGEPNPNIIDYVLKTGRIQELANHTVLEDKNGNQIPIADSAAPITNERGEIHGAVMVFRDVSAEKEKKERILYLSYHDTVTGLFNRRFFDDEIEKLDHVKYYPLAIVMGDVNGLKMTNDVFGHELGDKLLKTIADTIVENISSTDIAIRWGGDEFVILMPYTDEKAADGFVEKMKRQLKSKRLNEVIKISVSFGHAVKVDADDDVSILLQKAEEAMYKMKLLESKSQKNAIVTAVLATLYERSTETKEHADRLEKYCLSMGEQLKLRSEAMGELSLFAMLHDIGKVGVDQYVLQKPDKLSQEEWIEMKRHPEIGYRIAQNIPELSLVSDFILHHHERWDGNGYPEGLKGESIPLHCRILAIADAYDAMINDRIYRKAMKRHEAIEELRRHAGTQFDPSIVNIFVEQLQNGYF